MMIQPQIDFCCFRLVAINIALTHCYKLVSFLNLINHKRYSALYAIVRPSVCLSITPVDQVEVRIKQLSPQVAP